MDKQLVEKSRYKIICEAMDKCREDAVLVKLFNDYLTDTGKMFVPLMPMEKWEEACEKYDIRGKHIDSFRKYDEYFFGVKDTEQWIASEEYLYGIFEYTHEGELCQRHYSKLPDSEFLAVLETLQYKDIDKVKEQIKAAEKRYGTIKDILWSKGNMNLFVKWYNNYLSKSFRYCTEIQLTELTQANWEEAVDKYNISAKKVKLMCDWHSHFYSVDGCIYTVNGENMPWDLSYNEFIACARWYAETENNYKECLKILEYEEPKPEPAKLLKYCFCSKEHGNCTKEEIISLVEKTDKPFVYTYGLAYRNPTTHRKPMSKEEAVNKVKSNGMIDITEEAEVIHIEEFSENDMW